MLTVILVLLALFVLRPYLGLIRSSSRSTKEFEESVMEVKIITDSRLEAKRSGSEEGPEVIGIEYSHPTDSSRCGYIPVKNSKSLVHIRVRKDLLSRPFNNN